MVNLNSVLNDRISRIARKEIKARTGAAKRLTTQYRRDIAALKRQMAALSKSIGFLERAEKRRVSEQPATAPEAGDKLRFRADGLKTHRAKLGLSAADYGKLVGVSGLTIYHWESGKARPRQQQLGKLAAVRGIGKREALKRLELVGGGSATGPNKRQVRRGGQTASEFILQLVKSRKATTSLAINQAWKASGRPGKADNTLSLLCKSGTLKREKLEGERGSQYKVA